MCSIGSRSHSTGVSIIVTIHPNGKPINNADTIAIAFRFNPDTHRSYIQEFPRILTSIWQLELMGNKPLKATPQLAFLPLLCPFTCDQFCIAGDSVPPIYPE